MFNFMKSSPSASMTDAVPNTKSAQPLIALQLGGGAHWTPRNYASLCREGFARNPIVYRCVRLIAEAAASVPFNLEGDNQAELCLSRTSSQEGVTTTFEQFYGYLQLSGEAYLEAGHIGDKLGFITALCPEDVTPLETKNGRIAGWEIAQSNGTKRRAALNVATGQSPLLHMSLFSPRETLSPLEAAAQAIDLHNEGGRWAKALLENSARPSGALIYKGTGGSDHLTDDQFDRLKSELESKHSGSRHAGRPLVLEGGLDWKSMSLSPTDMDFIQARREAAREIALAFGVPPMLLGLPGDNTYANYREANLAFWRQTIIPLVNKTATGLQNWMRPWFDDDVSVSVDLEKVPALSEDRNALWQRLSAVDFLSDEEKRRLAGVTSIGGRDD